MVQPYKGIDIIGRSVAAITANILLNLFSALSFFPVFLDGIAHLAR